MRKVIFLSAFFLLLFSHESISQVQTFESKEETKALCDKFMEGIIARDVQGSFKILKPYFKVASDEDFAKLQLQTINQLDAYTERFGFPIGGQLVKQREIKDLLIEYTYLEKYESNLLRWSFIFYKPQNKWIFQSLSWDENVQAVFD